MAVTPPVTLPTTSTTNNLGVDNAATVTVFEISRFLVPELMETHYGTP